MKTKDDDSIVEIDNKLLIACYKKPYSKASLKTIQKIIIDEKPSKIVVLKVIEEPKVSKKIESRVGVATKNDFLESVIDDKKAQLDDMAEQIISMIDKTDIPVQVHLRKSKEISNKVLSLFNRLDVDHLVIPNTEKGPFRQLIEDSTKEKIKDRVDRREVTVLD